LGSFKHSFASISDIVLIVALALCLLCCINDLVDLDTFGHESSLHKNHLFSYKKFPILTLISHTIHYLIHLDSFYVTASNTTSFILSPNHGQWIYSYCWKLSSYCCYYLCLYWWNINFANFLYVNTNVTIEGCCGVQSLRIFATIFTNFLYVL
jgi:hypothetical protein